MHTLAGTDLTVSTSVLGTMTFGGQVDAADAARMVALAREAGVNVFDTANNYNGGASEEILGSAIANCRDDVVICTKAGNTVEQDGRTLRGLGRAALRSALDGSLRRLGVDHVDVYYLHRPDPATPFAETLETLGGFVRAGKVRHVAQSNHAAWQVAEMIVTAEHRNLPVPRIAQPQYNLLSRRVESEYAACSEHHGLSNVVYNPLAGGLLTGKHVAGESHAPGTRFTKKTYQDRYWRPEMFAAVERLRTIADESGLTLVELALRWVRDRPLTGCVLLGASSPEQLVSNLAGMGGPPLDADSAAACDAVWHDLEGVAPPYHR